MTPTRKEVQEQIAEVWVDIEILAATPEGLQMMQDVLDEEVRHEE